MGINRVSPHDISSNDENSERDEDLDNDSSHLSYDTSSNDENSERDEDLESSSEVVGKMECKNASSEPIYRPMQVNNFLHIYDLLFQKLNRKLVVLKEQNKDMTEMDKMIKYLHILMNELNTITFKMEDMIDNLDRNSLSGLTEEDNLRIQDYEQLERLIEKIKPAMILAMLSETL